MTPLDPSRLPSTDRFAQRHAVLLYGALAYAFSWTYWLTLLAHGMRVEPGSDATHLPGLLGPFLAAILVTALADGSGGVWRLLRDCVRLPPPRWRWAMVATSPVWAGALIFGALAVFGQPLPAPQDFNSYPGLPQSVPLALAFGAALVLNGLGEEAGWRGFALARLAQGRSPLKAALWVAAAWLLWHAPLFALNTGMRQLLGPALLGWALGLTAGSLVLAWLYLKSRSVLVVAVWHTGFNFVVATAPGQGLVAAVASTVVMVLAAAVSAAWWRQGRHLTDAHRGPLRRSAMPLTACDRTTGQTPPAGSPSGSTTPVTDVPGTPAMSGGLPSSGAKAPSTNSTPGSSSGNAAR